MDSCPALVFSQLMLHSWSSAFVMFYYRFHLIVQHLGFQCVAIFAVMTCKTARLASPDGLFRLAERPVLRRGLSAMPLQLCLCKENLPSIFCIPRQPTPACLSHTPHSYVQERNAFPFAQSDAR